MSDHKPDMFDDMQAAAWFVAKVRASKSYAQNLYAALCNNDFQKHEVWPMLKNDTRSVSWRGAGSLVADLRNEGDYMDWYCSFQRLPATYDEKEGEEYMARKQYVSEGTVTDEIREDLGRLGWLVSTDTKKG
jgi:hypothetical protein